MRPATLFRYTPPTFTLPYRLHLANLPTPLHTFIPSSPSSTTTILPHNATLLVKRDDFTGGIELGGNKIRKLEFLLADALSSSSSSSSTPSYDTVVTIGGIQSNHCRATAAACRMVGLTPHLILRSKNVLEEDDDLTGNLLVDRMVGARIQRVTPGEYGRFGQKALLDVVVRNLKREGKRPYGIPVGGSNGLGTWGYVEAVSELLHQLKNDNLKINHVVCATGSGGTATGIVLGLLMGMAAMGDNNNMPKLHAVGVCDDPDYFYKTMVDIAEEMGFRGDDFLEKADGDDDDTSSSSLLLEDLFRRIVTVHQGKGRGYAASTPAELEFMTQFSVATGIVLDPVYTGKAMYHFVTTVMMNDEEEFWDKTVLFWHTGGALGMYDKERELMEQTTGLKRSSIVDKLDVYGSLKEKSNLDKTTH